MALVLRNILKLNKRAVYCQVMTKQFASTKEGSGDKKSKGKGKDGEKGKEAEKVPENIVIEKNEAVTLIGINRPEKRNCVDSLTANQLISGKIHDKTIFRASPNGNCTHFQQSTTLKQTKNRQLVFCMELGAHFVQDMISQRQLMVGRMQLSPEPMG